MVHKEGSIGKEANIDYCVAYLISSLAETREGALSFFLGKWNS